MTLYRQPAWRVTLAGRDLTGILQPRLERLEISESREEEADQLDITLTDYDGALDLPTMGAVLQVQLGWADTGLVDKGTYTVDEIEYSGSPDVLVLRARSADMQAALRTRNERSFDRKTVREIVSTIAAAHDLQPVVGAMGAQVIPHIDQVGESDIAFLDRLGRRHDAVATIKDGHLLFLPIVPATTASGKPLPEIVIHRSDGDQHRYHLAARDTYSGVRAYWHDPRRATRRSVIAGTSGNAKRLRDTYASEEDAFAAACAEWERLQRGEVTMEYSLAYGRPEVGVQRPVRFRGFKPQIEEGKWLVKSARHSLGEGGLVTTLEMEMLERTRFETLE